MKKIIHECKVPIHSLLVATAVNWIGPGTAVAKSSAMKLKSILSIFLCLQFLSILFVALPCFAMSACDKIIADADANLSDLSLWNLLDSKSNNGAEIIEYLSRDPEIKRLFESDAGVWEGYSIKKHTLMVFDVFNEQFHLYQARYSFKTPSDFRLFQTLKLAIALHDIGKPLAIQAGDKRLQHLYTLPILQKALSSFKFSENEIKLATTLVGRGAIGSLVKSRRPLDIPVAKSRLDESAHQAGMSLIDYLPLQFLFYTIDAAAYPYLRFNVFRTTKEGLLVPNRPVFEQLWHEFSKP